ncbi:MAG: hypothetical protein KC996_02950 [Phycisphaerales bacterium]|nr:hypothetical protein [Phycisphaerales bacterium]
MNELLNRIFGLKDIGFGSPDTAFTFLHTPGLWAWALAMIAIGALSWWSYRGLSGSTSLRAVLASVRTLLVLTVLLLAAGPMLERVTMHTERDTVLVLLDRSGSLETPDVEGRTRDTQLRAMLENAAEPWTTLAATKRVVYFGFNDRATPLSTQDIPGDIAPLGGRGSNIAGAIRTALDTNTASPIAGIVLVSDGQSTDTIDPELLNQLASARIPVFPVALGSTEPVRDLAITRIQTPDLVFADDRVPIRVDLSWTGIENASPQGDQQPTTLDLVDHSTGQTIRSIKIDPADFAQTGEHQYTLLHELNAPGENTLDVVLRTANTADLNADNNTGSVTIRVADRPLRVLYIDGYPRWEQRYLKNLLTREDSIAGTAMLLAPDRHYVQDGDVLISRVPTSADEWSPYDVVILGDVRAELFTPEQLEGLREHIADHGAGLLWIGGPSATPSSWFATPSAGLLPMTPGVQGIDVWDQPVTMGSTPEADRLGILQLDETGWADRLSDPSTGWSQLRLVQRIEHSELKPAAAVLAEAYPIDGSADTTPAVLTMRYAAGRVGYVATDEIWRWRYGRGEALPERFWLPMIRMLARGSVARGSTPALLRVSPSTPEPLSPVQISVELLDQSLIDTMPSVLEASITRMGAEDTPTTVSLAGDGPLRLGSWIPSEPGHYRVSLSDAALVSVSAQTLVLESSDERRSLDTDFALLDELAGRTDGQSVPPSEFGSIPELLPNRARVTALPPNRVPLWNRPLVLALLVLLVTTEWIARKALRLA